MNIFDLPDKDLRLFASSLKKENKTFPDQMEPFSNPDAMAHKHPQFFKAWRSKTFLVQIYKVGEDCLRFSVNRTEIDITNRRWRDKITWDDLQRIKRECGYGDYEAVEIFPKDEDVVNVANMRHIWIFLKGGFPFTWKKGRPHL